MTGHQDDLCLWLFFIEAAQDVITFMVVSGAEPDITKHQRPHMAAQQVERAFSGLGLSDFPAFVAQNLGNIAANQIVIVNYQCFHYREFPKVYYLARRMSKWSKAWARKSP